MNGKAAQLRTFPHCIIHLGSIPILKFGPGLFLGFAFQTKGCRLKREKKANINLTKKKHLQISPQHGIK